MDGTFGWILLNLLDIVLTILLVKNGAVEQMPLARTIIAAWGLLGFVIFRAVLVVVSLFVLVQFRHVVTTVANFLMFLVVCVNVGTLIMTYLLSMFVR